MPQKITEKLEITDAAGSKTLVMVDGSSGWIRVDNDKASSLELWGGSSVVPGAQIYSGGFIAMGGTADGDGELRLYAKGARTSIMDITNFRVHLSGDHGRMTLKDPTGRQVVVQVSAEDGAALVGGGGKEGVVAARDAQGRAMVSLNAQNALVAAGGSGRDGAVSVRDKTGAETVRIDGAKGDILLTNADCAEDFDVIADVDAEPGTLMTLGDDGRLQPCSVAYDRRVAGVVSGAGAYRPGIVLDRQPEVERPRAPIAMVGKVYCKVDAGHGAVAIGDLLTSSPTPGHAMKAADAQRAFGAVVGKALKPLAEGCGMVPILVALQ